MGSRGGLICRAHSHRHALTVEDSGSLVFFRLAVLAQKEQEKNSRDLFCCFLVSIKLSICLFLLKVQCVKIQPASRKGPWCVLKENRDIVQNVTAEFTYCSTGC